MNGNRKALSALLKFEDAVRRVFFTIFPNVGKYDKSFFARVVKVNVEGGKVDGTNKRYSVDVQILQGNFEVDDNFEKIVDVPLDCYNFGGGGVMYVTPKAGAIVRIRFMYNDPSFPYVESVTAEGADIPEGAVDEFRIQTANGTILQIKEGKVNIKTSKINTDIDTIIDNTLNHTHLGNTGAPTSPPSGGVPPTTIANYQNGSL